MRFGTALVAQRVRASSLASALQSGCSGGRNTFTRWGCRAASALSTCSSTVASCSGALGEGSCVTTLRRWQSSGYQRGSIDDEVESGGYGAEDPTELHHDLAQELAGEGNLSMEAALSQPLVRADLQTPTARIALEKIERPPGRFDLLTNSIVYRWMTTAGLARKVSGPMREWATELKYRTGVHIEVEPTYPMRTTAPVSEGGYASADEVELTVYLFGSERGIFNCRQLMEAALDQDPAYVRLGVFRRKPRKSSSNSSDAAAHQQTSIGGSGSATGSANEEVEWLMLRRFNRDLRPPDIPPISLKLPGKWTMLFEQYKEAAVRSLWEETGITVDPNTVFPTARLSQDNPEFYWRVPVHYFVAEVPYDVEVRGPQVGQNIYMRHWDTQLLRQSPDPIDRAWAQLADPETGCAWVKAPMIDELQRPLRGENYMFTRYTPPPYSGLNEVLGFAVPEAAAAASSEAAAAGAEAAATEEAAEVGEQEAETTTPANALGGAADTPFEPSPTEPAPKS